MKTALALLLALGLVAAGCGDDDAEGVDNELVDSLTQRIIDEGAGSDDIPLTNAQAGCFVEGLVDEFGGERMVQALDMEFEEFIGDATLDERVAVVDAMMECVDFADVMAAQFGDVISSDSARCVGDAFVDSQAFRTAVANSFVDSDADPFQDPALVEEMLPAMLECLTAEELIQLGESGNQ